MSEDGALAKYTRRELEPRGDSSAEPPEEIQDCGAFGWLRGLRDRALMLQLRKKNGNVRAIAYHLIETVDFDPSNGVIIKAAGLKVHIRGRNLNAPAAGSVTLIDGLARHRVPWIREASLGEVMRQNGTCLVESIEW